MSSVVVVYGTGSSAKGFLSHLGKQFRVLAVASDNQNIVEVSGVPHVNTKKVASLSFDFVVVASWAIHPIRDRLSALNVSDDKILWYQHHKDRLVPYSHQDCRQTHAEYPASEVLYAFYDLNVARATFDIVGFLCLAESHRIELELSALQVIIVNAENNDFNNARWGVHSKSEHDWRISEILQPCCKLIPSCIGASYTSCRKEAHAIAELATHIFPANYTVKEPICLFEFNHLFDRVSDGFDVQHFRANPLALSYIDKYIAAFNPNKKPLISITLRDTIGKPRRNSLITEWEKTVKWLVSLGHAVVIVPDTDNPTFRFSDDLQFYFVADVVCFNVHLRMALYERSYLNLGVNNGPMHLCALNKKCDYIMYKQIVEEYPHSALESFLKRGFTVNGDFPGAKLTQKLVWQEDQFEIIASTVKEIIEVKNTLNAQTTCPS